jgi:hypothetical protein
MVCFLVLLYHFLFVIVGDMCLILSGPQYTFPHPLFDPTKQDSLRDMTHDAFLIGGTRVIVLDVERQYRVKVWLLSLPFGFRY